MHAILTICDTQTSKSQQRNHPCAVWTWTGWLKRPHPLPSIGEELDLDDLTVDGFVAVRSIRWHANGVAEITVYAEPRFPQLIAAGFVDADTPGLDIMARRVACTTPRQRSGEQRTTLAILAIYEHLMGHASITAAELQKLLGSVSGGLSLRLKLLEQEGILEAWTDSQRPRGKGVKTFYGLTPEGRKLAKRELKKAQRKP